MRPLISFDWAIKRLLRSKANFGILEGFLSELLNRGKDLKIKQLLESESNRADEDNKLNRVDILAELDTGELVLIEVQVDRQIDFFHRMLFGTSRIISEHFKIESGYKDIKKVYSVNILYFDLGHGEDYIYHGTTNFIGIHNHDQLELSAKQKEAYSKDSVRDIYPEYYLIKVNSFNDLAKDSLDEWIYFLKNEEIKGEFQAKGLAEASEKLSVMKLPEQERIDYAKYLENLHYQASMLGGRYEEGRAEGKAKGKAEGKAEGIIEIAKNLKALSTPIETIVRATGLSIEEIEAL